MAAEAKYKITAVDNTKAAVSSVKKSLAGIGTAAGGLKTQIAAGLAALGGIAALKESFDFGGEVNDLSKRLGVSAEALSQYRYVADQTGTTLQNVANSWKLLSRNLSDAAAGTGEARQALRDLGLSAAELISMRPDEQFERIAEALGKADNAPDRVALAMDLFGRSGAEMLQMMDNGAEGIRAMRAEADAMGLTLSQVDAERLDAAGDAMARVKAAGSKLAQDLAITLAPTIEVIANWLADHLPFAVGHTVRAFHKARAEILDSVVYITRAMTALMQTMALIPGPLGEKFEDVFDTLKAIRNKAKEWATGAASDYEQATVQLDSMADTLAKARARVAALGVGVGQNSDEFKRMGKESEAAKRAFDAHVDSYEAYLSAKARFEEARGPLDAQAEAYEQFKSEQADALAALEGGLGGADMDILNEYGSGWIALGEMVNFAGQLAGEGLSSFIDATVAAIGGSKKAFSEMGKAVLKWAADTVKSIAVTAAAKALFYKAEAIALALNPLTAPLAPMAAAAAGAYGIMAAAAGGLAIALGAISAANAPSGSFMSQQERESTTGLAHSDEGDVGREQTFSRGALTAANMTVTHIYNGPVYFGSQDLASAVGIQRIIDSGELYFAGSQ